MIRPYRIRLENGKISEKTEYCVVERMKPSVTWAIAAVESVAYQTAYRLTVQRGKEILWDTDWVMTPEQKAVYDGAEFRVGEKMTLTVMVKDSVGNISVPESVDFYYGTLDPWPAEWIGETNPQEDRVICFERDIKLKKPVYSACLFSSGIGYQKISVNGVAVEKEFMNPAYSEYEKRCYYCVYPEIGSYLRMGENTLQIQVAAGWRSPYNVCYKLTGRIPDYVGVSQLTAALRLVYEDRSEEWIYTDENWNYHYSPIVYSNIFEGETYESDYVSKSYSAKKVQAPGGSMMLQTLEPVREQEVYPAISVSTVKKGTYGIDFGQNIAGVVRIRLPKHMKPGQVISISHMEFLDEDGQLYLPNLRNATCIDRYIASGDEKDLEYWQPQFTYHGFRYVQIEGYRAPMTKEDICAVSLYSDIGTGSYFSCGNALINAIQKNIVQTEKANIHSILTDCPQRDERMGWMNDATVRFEETPYNFDIGRLFPKVVRDLLDVQGKEGEITCTAPFAFGARPADPVCSSFLIAALEAYEFTGNLDIIREGYEGFKAWNTYLGSRSRDNIVQYSYYGDWAGPAYACIGEDGVLSSETPGILMSTGYYFYNARLLAKYAGLLGYKEEQKAHEKKAEEIRTAFLKKWWDEKNACVATGSQGCQAFALWLGILPETQRQKAADRMHDDLVKQEYKFTTGNLCTRYLFDMLTEYGYVDDAYRLITSEKYPSFGFMIGQEATTIWERFELKKNNTMNSHNHPMYGAVGRWFYTHLAGMKPLEAGFSRVKIKPYYPAKLMSVQAVLETIKGDIIVRWVKRYGRTHLYVTVPFGVEAEVVIPDGVHKVQGGFHYFEWPYGPELDEYGYPVFDR